MSPSTLFAFLLSFVLVAGVWSLRRRPDPATAAMAAREALRFCERLLRLLSSLQQHRGLSSGWLAGDRAFESRMQARRQEIDALLAELGPFVERETAQARPCLTLHDLSLFRFQWRSLCESLVPGGQVEDNIARHSQLIAQVLDWLAGVGEARIEQTAGQRLPAGIVRNHAGRLPALSETLGLARAIGSSVAARQGCSAVARVRLVFLVSRAESLLEQACADGRLGSAGSQAKLAVEHLAQTVRGELLASSGVTLGADAYFQIATQAVDGVLEWARHCGAQIDRELAAAHRSRREGFAASPHLAAR